MSLSVRDIAFFTVALLAFPLVMTLTSVTASDDGTGRQEPLFQRGGGEQIPSAFEASSNE